MRTVVLTSILALGVSTAVAQTVSPSQTERLKEGTGRTDIQSHQPNSQQTPQGPSGPLNTTTGGPPASSPQGQTPPGMQAAPEGSDKKIIDTKDK